MLGLDILIDEEWNCWLMEVNANPSLNVYSDKELPNGDIEQTLSELDKYVKSSIIADTFKLLEEAPILSSSRKPLEGCKLYKCPAVSQQGSLKLILPQPLKYEELYLYSRAESIFEWLAGQKSFDFLTNPQFQRLSKF